MLLAVSSQIASQISQLYSHTNSLFEYHINIEFFKNHPRKGVFRNVNLINLENVLQRNLKTGRARECIFRAS